MVPPAKSKILVALDRDGRETVSLPSPGSPMRYPIAAFLVFWLGGWLVGLLSAIHELVTNSKAPSAFLIFWVGGWTVGGGFAFWTLYRMLRPGVPEKLTLAPSELIYDSGIQPYNMMSFYNMSSRNRMNPWKKMFQKRRVLRLTTKDLTTLKLRDMEGGNRLTVDWENERIDIGEGLTEVEREWLFTELKSAYKL